MYRMSKRVESWVFYDCQICGQTLVVKDKSQLAEGVFAHCKCSLDCGHNCHILLAYKIQNGEKYTSKVPDILIWTTPIINTLFATIK